MPVLVTRSTIERTRPFTRSRAPTLNENEITSNAPDMNPSNPSVVLPNHVGSNNGISLCPNEIGMSRGRRGLEILADASSASRTPDNIRSTDVASTAEKISTAPVISKNKRKAPSRSTELKVPSEQEPCCICLTPPLPVDLASVNGCDHVYCFDCIEKWGERENSCPLCKQRFTKIDRVNKKPRRTKAEVAAKLPVCKNTKTVRNRNQAADRARIPIQDLIANMDVPETAPSRNIFQLLFSSQLGLDISGLSHSPPGSQFQVESLPSDADEHNFFSEDDDSFDGDFQSFIFGNRSYHRGNITASAHRNPFSSNPNNPFSSISLQPSARHNPFSSISLQPPTIRGTTPDTALEIHDSDDDDDDDVMIIMNHNDGQSQQQQQRPPTPHPYV